jgi:acetylornithine deacetylase/succinyl-diaminopimelate desuccinylase-like protein
VAEATSGGRSAAPAGDRSAAVRLSAADVAWLRALMAVPSVSPLEGGDPDTVIAAQRVLVEGASARGLGYRRWDSPPLSALDRPEVPVSVREAAAADPAAFLAAQPSVVVACGRPQPPERRIVVNFHVDTVGPHVEPRLSGRVLHGRGAVDDKGPGVAAAVGVAAAFDAAPWLADSVEVLVASVPGEEGGAMGVYGTRWLVESGCVGRLMLFAEPTGCRVLDACSAAMTPRISVIGDDSTDDHPAAGHNATLALGFLAVYLGRELGPFAERVGGKLCIAGLHTGTLHNRVHGQGQLRLNIAYYDRKAAELLAAAVERLVSAASTEFARVFDGNPLARRLVADWERVVRLDWLKRGLPPLANRDPAMEALLAGCGLTRHDGVADGTAATCDAIWADGLDGYAAACGPGRLDANGAHTPGEFVELDELDRYATRIRDLVLRFGSHITGRSEEAPA